MRTRKATQVELPPPRAPQPLGPHHRSRVWVDTRWTCLTCTRVVQTSVAECGEWIETEEGGVICRAPHPIYRCSCNLIFAE